MRLEENYRSTPQVLELANRLVPKLGGAEKALRPTLDDGPEPVVRAFATAEAEGAAIAAEIRALGAPYERIAILARTNARLTDFEELLHDAHIPFQGASLLERDAARRLLRRLERVGDVDAEEAVRAAALDAGWLVQLPDKLGEREVVRQTDLARLVSLASIFDGSAAEFVVDLRRRFDSGADAAKGVHLLTLHRAKGLEFDAVFLPRLEEKELPSRQARTPAEIAEERRLLYVGMTRAKRVLWLTWSSRPSRFLAELGIAAAAPLGDPKPKKGKFVPTPGSDGLYHELAVWRRARAEEDEVPPYVVFDNKTLDAIARTRPRTLHDLASLPGRRAGQARALRRPGAGRRRPRLRARSAAGRASAADRGARGCSRQRRACAGRARAGRSAGAAARRGSAARRRRRAGRRRSCRRARRARPLRGSSSRPPRRRDPRTRSGSARRPLRPGRSRTAAPGT